MRFVVAIALLFGLLAMRAAPALADCTSTNVNVSKATRSKASYSVAAYAFFISREDCLDGDEFTFPYVLQNIGTNSFEVWVAPNSSTDCSLNTSRDNSTGTTKCKQVYVNGAPSAFGQVKIKASVIAGAIDGVSGCDFTGSNTAPIPTNIYFMLVAGANTTADPAGVCNWANTSVDLVGPAPPTNLQAGVGDTIATLTYDVGTNQQDVLGYKFYCDPPPGASASGTGGAGGSSVVATAAATTSATSSATTGAGGAGGGGGAGGSGGGSTTGSGVSSGTNGGAVGCPSSALVAGQVPDSKYECGKTNGISGNATGLTNGVTYAIGVAGYDNLGNPGKLSTMVCVTPGPVDDFFSVYREAGGKAGGCAVRPSDARSGESSTTEGAGLFFGLGLVGVAALLRRRSALRDRRRG